MRAPSVRTDHVASRPRSTRSVFWTAFALLAMLATLWSLASPLFSIPDENAHVTKAVAQLRGEVIGESIPGRAHLIVDLPEGYEYNHSAMCFLFVSELPAKCLVEYGDGTGESEFATWVGTYNPIYYYLVGWPSLVFENGAVGVYAMRILSALLGSLLLAWAFQAGLASRSARWMPLGLAFLATPMVVYLIGSVNPNGVEIAAGAALWVSLLRLMQRHGPALGQGGSSLSTWYLWVIVTVSSVLLVNARAIGPLWLVVIVGSCLIASGWSATKELFLRKASYPWLAVIAAGSVFSGVWTLATGGAAGQAGANDAPLVGAPFLVGFAAMLRRTGDFVQQAIGFFGWLDTPLPGVTYILFYVILGVLVLLVLAGTDRRGWLTMGGILALSVLLPAVVQGLQVSRTGLIWQGRYGLVIYLAIPIVAAWILSGRAGSRLDFLSVRFAWIGACALGIYGLLAYGYVMRRYVTGLGAPLDELFVNTPWQPPLGWIPLTIAYTVTTVALVWWVGRLAATLAEPRTSVDVDFRV